MAILLFRDQANEDVPIPARQSSAQMNPTLIVSWWCTLFSLTVILIRIFGRWVRTEKLFREDKVMLWSIIPLLIRQAFIHPVLLWGTNNIQVGGLNQQEIDHRMIGSRMVLGARVFYAVYLWSAKVTILEFVRKIIGQTWTRFYDKGARIIYVFLGFSLAGVIVSILAECQPFSHYWQVVPPPAAVCRTAPAQLIVMGVLDIVTDLVLMVFPIPLVIMSKMPAKKKASLVLLFLLSIIPLAITAYRVPAVKSRGYSQQFRSLLASLEIFAATCVANVIVIGSFLRDKGVKKAKFRAGSIGTEDYDGGSPLDRPVTQTHKPSVAQRHWGSDEDLVRDLGLTVSHELREDTMFRGTARLTPIAEPAQPFSDLSSPEPAIAPQGRGLIDPAWTFRKGSQPNTKRRDSDVSSDSDASGDLKLQILEPYHDDEPTSPGAMPETPYKKVSFFDVGGLVETAPSEHSSNDYSSRRLSQIRDSAPMTRSGQNFIADVGGLLGPSTRHGQGHSSAVESDQVAQQAGQSSMLSLPRAIRERSRSPFAGLRRAHESRDGPPSSSGAIPRELEGPDALNISDAGGLLK